MIISFMYYVTLSKFVDSSFPQCNVHTGVQGWCWAFTPLDGYLKLWELISFMLSGIGVYIGNATLYYKHNTIHTYQHIEKGHVSYVACWGTLFFVVSKYKNVYHLNDQLVP